MAYCKGVFFLLFVVLVFLSPGSFSSSSEKPFPSTYLPSLHTVPIVYIYTIVPKVCEKGFPSYIFDIWRHLVKFHSMNNDLVFLSNFQSCPVLRQQASQHPDYRWIHFIDTDTIKSMKTMNFLNRSKNVFMSDGGGELWFTSATRFFHLDDFLTTFNLSNAIHLEADNVVYSNFSHTSSHIHQLRKNYPNLSTTPLVANKHLLTASFFWVGNRLSCSLLTEFFFKLISKDPPTLWEGYVNYLRRYESSKRVGVEPDAFGRTIKPFAINEMTMLAYYHVLQSTELAFLPVVSYYHRYQQYRPFCDLKHFQPYGLETKGGLLSVEYYRGEELNEEKARRVRDDNTSVVHVYSIFDAGSWGQYLGGTQKKRGRDPGFVDSAHISAQARISFDCIPEMLCENITRITRNIQTEELDEGQKCYTAPFVRCQDEMTYTPIVNLHVHSKHVHKFVSQECPCPVLPH